MLRELLLMLPLLISKSVFVLSFEFDTEQHTVQAVENNNLYVNTIDSNNFNYGAYDNFFYVDCSTVVDYEFFDLYNLLGQVSFNINGINDSVVIPKLLVNTEQFEYKYLLENRDDVNYLTFAYSIDLPYNTYTSSFDSDVVYGKDDRSNLPLTYIDDMYFYLLNTDLEKYRNGNFYIYTTVTNTANYEFYRTLIDLHSYYSNGVYGYYFSGDDINVNGVITNAITNGDIDSLSLSFMLIYAYGNESIGDDVLDQIYDSGYNAGYQVGYSTGFNAGTLSQDGTINFLTLFGGIADTPVLMLRSLFNFDLFGVQMYTIVFGLVTALIVLWIIRKVV